MNSIRKTTLQGLSNSVDYGTYYGYVKDNFSGTIEMKSNDQKKLYNSLKNIKEKKL